MAVAIRITTIAITIISSMSVKPERPFFLPICISTPVQSLVRALGEYSEDVLAAPAVGFWIVLHTALSPFLRLSHRVHRNPPQELDLGIGIGARPLDAIDEDVKRFGVALIVSLLNAQFAGVALIFVLIDSGVDF